MKSIIFLIFIIISFSAISSKNLRAQEIFKRSTNHPPSNPHISNGNQIVFEKRGGPVFTNRERAKPKIPKKDDRYIVYKN